MASGPTGLDPFESSVDLGTLALAQTRTPGPHLSIPSLAPLTWPLPSQGAVFAAAEEFLITWEVDPAKRKKDASPYLVKGKGGIIDKNSGVTCGIGYDLGQSDEKQIRADFRNLPRENLDALVKAARLTGNTQTTAEKTFTDNQLARMNIPWKIQLEAFRESSLPKHYQIALKAFPGMAMLPLGTQMALLSLVFNRGGGKWGNKKHEEVLDSRWELRRLAEAAASRNLHAIAELLQSMERLWPGSKGVNKGLRGRREAEAKLVLADYYLFIKPNETESSSPYSRFHLL